MSIKIRLLLIVLVLTVVIFVFTGTAYWNILRNRHQMIIINNALSDIYTITSMRLGFSRQMKEAADYVFSCSNKDKMEFKNEILKNINAINNFIDSEKDSVDVGRKGDEWHLNFGRYLKDKYTSITDTMEAFSDKDIRDDRSSAFAFVEKHMGWMKDDLVALRHILEEELHDINNSYKEALVTIGLMPWIANDGKRQIDISHTSLKYYLSVDKAFWNINRQIFMITEYLTSGKLIYKKEYEQAKENTNEAMKHWMEALKAHLKLGLEGEKEDMKALKNIKNEYTKLTALSAHMIDLIEQNKSQEAYEIMENHIEPLIDSVLIPMLNDVIDDSKKECFAANNKLFNLVFSASLKSIIISLSFFIFIGISTFTILRGIFRTEDEIRQSEEKFRAISTAANDAIITVDNKGIIIFWNEAAENIFGYTNEEAINEKLHELIFPDKHSNTYLKALPVFSRFGDSTFLNKTVELTGCRKNIQTHEIEEFPIEISLSSMKVKDARWIVAVIRDITERKLKENQIHILNDNLLQQTNELTEKTKELEKLNRQLEISSTTDALTGLCNRRKFESLLKEEILRFKRYDTPTSLIILDIDHFKKINDTYGHNVGDDVLKEFSALAKANIRTCDIVARWGGEEFIVLLPMTTVEHAVEVAEKLRLKIQDHGFYEVKSVTSSFGVTELKSKDTMEGFIKRADDALYKAKTQGRNQVVSQT